MNDTTPLLVPERLSGLVAPDGRPAAEHFQRWFGGSQVVDAQGAPLVVFHGTGLDIERFREGPAFFTSDPEMASGYARRAGDGGNVMPVYLALKNPKRMDFLPPHVPSYYERRRRALYSQGYDGIVTSDGVCVAFWPGQIKSALGNSGLFRGDSNLVNDLEPCQLAPTRLVSPPVQAQSPASAPRRARPR
ncbi:ADP-ribosyltransferase-containing protein [Paucibacter soli]|uniref:ADP-ribosyltransferase-containing protein n=1 Tax=Paucibacter soli TaxID=3133433 RepID=UPI0030B162DA